VLLLRELLLVRRPHHWQSATPAGHLQRAELLTDAAAQHPSYTLRCCKPWCSSWQRLWAGPQYIRRQGLLLLQQLVLEWLWLWRGVLRLLLHAGGCRCCSCLQAFCICCQLNVLL